MKRQVHQLLAALFSLLPSLLPHSGQLMGKVFQLGLLSIIQLQAFADLLHDTLTTVFRAEPLLGPGQAGC